MSDLSADEARRQAEQVDGGWPELAALLRRYADASDSSETVESLRAERDEARAEVDEIKASTGYWREQCRLVCDESEDRKNDLVRLRATHWAAEVAWARIKPGASDTADLRVRRHPAHWPGGEHWLGGDHSNQTPREQDGKTPGRTMWVARWGDGPSFDSARIELRELYEKVANAVLAAHGTPTLTPVGEHPEPGTRGLMPVVVDVDNDWSYGDGFSALLCATRSETGRTILADPRPDGA